MDIRQLTYFAAVADERHLGRAAARLHLSQPPLTRHIKALEAELGVDLFRRTPRGMLLTQAGEALLKDARGIFAMMKNAAERAQRAGRGQAGRLDVGLYGSASFGVVPRVLAEFRRSHPEVEMTLHYAQTPAQIPALRQGRVLIVFERLLPNEPDIEVELVARDRLVLAMSEHHPLATRKVVDIKALKNETLRIGTSPADAAVAVELCRRHGFEPHFAAPASDVIMATMLTSIGSEVALVPGSITNVRFPGIAYRPIEARVHAFMEVHCFYLRTERSPLLAAMLDTVRTLRADEEAAGRKPARARR
jgi:DNA-binding transcriptional LysR family regulator